MVNFVDPLGPAAPGGVIPAQTALFQIARHPADAPRFVGAHRARQNVFEDRQAACSRCGIRRCSHGSDDVARGTQQKSRQELSADETGRAGDENRPFGVNIFRHGRDGNDAAGRNEHPMGRAEARRRPSSSARMFLMEEEVAHVTRRGRSARGLCAPNPIPTPLPGPGTIAFRLRETRRHGWSRWEHEDG